MKHFKNVKSFDDLKKQFKELLKKYHPDNGGDVEIMKEVNVEFDSLFPIWKNRKEVETGEAIKETADSTRSQFYTMCGWEGKNHSWNRTLKEVAAIVRAYVKEKYPTYKFSVRTHYASMCQELFVDLKESPVEVYKTYDELTEDDKSDLIHKMIYNNLWTLDSWNDEECRKQMEKIWNENGNFYKCMNEITSAVVNDVDSFVKSYNFSDCDGMIDYFNVDFWYFGCAQNNGINIKVVPKTARIKNKDTSTKVAKTTKAAKENKENANVEKIGTSKITYTVKKDIDTRDNSVLWVVKINEELDKSQYISQKTKMRGIGAYYSKFKHGFIFREEPTELLKKIS